MPASPILRNFGPPNLSDRELHAETHVNDFSSGLPPNNWHTLWLFSVANLNRELGSSRLISSKSLSVKYEINLFPRKLVLNHQPCSVAIVVVDGISGGCSIN